MEPGQAHLEGVHIVFEVDDLQAAFLQLVELGGEELLEAHDRDAAALVQERLDLRQEVRVVAGQDDVARAELRDRVLATPLSEAGAPWDADRSSRSTSTLSSVGSSLGEALLWSILMSNSGSSSHHRNRWDDDHDSWSSGSSWGGSSGGGGGISSDQGNF